MLMYLRHAIEAHPELSRKETFTPEGLDEALYHGAVLRVRPKAMTVVVIIVVCCQYSGEPAQVQKS